MSASLTIGHIAYANCVPFFHYLNDCGFRGEICSGVPSALNRYLAEGSVDLSPSSSFEYLRNWHDYLLLPELSISAVGAVKSVLLFSPEPLENLQGKQIYLTGESASSIHLLQILLREFYGLSEVLCTVPAGALEEHVRRGQPALLIGDRALRTASEVSPEHIYDLGELWHRFTSLPFVFALWIIRKPVAERRAEQVGELFEQLRNALQRAFADLPRLAQELSDYEWYGEDSLVKYWQCMSYGLQAEHLQGLKLYAELLVKYGFLPQCPNIEFFDVQRR